MPRRPRIQSNLARDLDKDTRDELSDMVVENYQTDLNGRAEWESKRNDWFGLWLCQPDPTRRPPWPGAANVSLPLMASACNQFQSRSYASIFSAPEIVKVLAVEPNDVGRAKRVEQFMNWQLLVDMEEYEEQFDKLLQKLPIDGTAFKKVYWDENKQRPVAEYVSAVDVILPFKTRDLESARRICHRLYLHKDEIDERGRQGFYAHTEDTEVADTSEDDPVKQHAREIHGEGEPAREGEVPNLILECHMRHQLPGDSAPRPYIFWVDHKTRTLLRAVRREFKGNEISFFIDYHFIPNPEGFYSFGYGHFLANLNRLADTLFNQICDSGRLSNQPFGFYGRRAGFRSKNLNLVPGKMIEVEDASQVFFPNIQRLDQSLPQVLQLIDRYTELFTSNTEPLSGRQQKGVREPTARGTMALIEQGLVQFGVLTKRVYRAQRRELRQIFALNSIYLSEEKQYRVMGDTTNAPFGSVYRQDFTGRYDLVPQGDPSFASQGQRRGEATEIMQMALEHPLLGAPNPKTGQPMNPGALAAVTRDWLATYEKKDLVRHIPEPPPVPITATQENGMFMQGDTREPQPGEDHLEHITIHLELLESPWGKSMSADKVKNMMEHIQATQAMMMQEEQAQSMMTPPTEEPTEEQGMPPEEGGMPPEGGGALPGGAGFGPTPPEEGPGY